MISYSTNNSKESIVKIFEIKLLSLKYIILNGALRGLNLYSSGMKYDYKCNNC